MIALAWMTALVLAAPQIPSDPQVVAHVKRLPHIEETPLGRLPALLGDIRR